MVFIRRVVCAVFCLALSLVYETVCYPQERASVRFVTNVDLVQLPVIVFDAQGTVATDLKKSDFRLLDDGVEQRILYLERERLAVSFIILADLSSSMTGKIPFVQEAALSLLETDGDQAQRADQTQSADEYSLFGVGKRSKELLPFTHDPEDLERRIPQLLIPTNESTALFDGVWLGVAAARHEATNQHRAMIVITDGGDNHSRYNLKETKKFLEEADVPVFAVMAGEEFQLLDLFMPQPKRQSPFPGRKGLGPQLPGGAAANQIGPAERRGPHNMKVLTEATGGGVFTAREEDDLPRIVRTIGLAVRYRYILSYKPTRATDAKSSRSGVTGGQDSHRIHLELYPKEKFAHYSVPYYKRAYHSTE